MQLHDRIVWITGSAKRVGRAIALDLATRGAHIVVHYRSSRGEAEQLAEEISVIGSQTLLVQGDLARPADIAKMAGEIEERFGALDVLINNASNFLRTPLDDVTEEDWDSSLDVNLKGPFFCAQAAARLMRAPRRDQPAGGKIINIADSAAQRPYANHIPYMVSKAGLVTMTQALALELAPEIQVNAIGPGVVMPPPGMPDDERARALAHVPLERFGAPEDIVATVAYLLEGTDYITGQFIIVDGGRVIAQPKRR